MPDKEKTVDRRVIRTKKAIREAFAKLLTEKDINDITISDIAELADINRKTFYNYYDGIYQVVDEIENGLHPNVVKAVLNMFLSPETNPLHAQLICTTHSILLAEKNVRRDQVWVISKDSCGRSTLRRISDYPGTRTTDNIAQKYLLCAFGDIPNFS